MRILLRRPSVSFSRSSNRKVYYNPFQLKQPGDVVGSSAEEKILIQQEQAPSYYRIRYYGCSTSIQRRGAAAAVPPRQEQKHQQLIPPHSSRISIFPSYDHFHNNVPLATSSRCFSSSSSVNNDDDDDPDSDDDSKQQHYEHRHTGISVHPDSISKDILPGNVIMRTLRNGQKKPRYTELVYGYFWMLKDLKRSNEKPIQTNTKLIPEKKAKVLPSLHNLQALSSKMSDTKIQIPDYFLRKNRSRDPNAQCTLVAISYRDFGYQLLSSWIEPFQEALQISPSSSQSHDKRIEVYRLNISDGWFNKYVLRGIIHGLMKRNTPVEEHDHTLLYFGASSELDNFRDSLRMHNVLTGYVFLLDGIGRVRFAGCGEATQDEIDNLVRFAKDLTTTSGKGTGSSKFQQKKRPVGSSNKKRIPKGTTPSR